MAESLLDLKRIPAQLLEDRLETVKPLPAPEHEQYEVVKDRETGDHYLLYAYEHLQIADGNKESYYHLLPLEHDDVLGLVLGEQSCVYPDAWTRPYLRSGGEHDEYVWFDPSNFDEADAFERVGKELKDRLAAFKRGGVVDPEAVRRLLEDLDKLH